MGKPFPCAECQCPVDAQHTWGHARTQHSCGGERTQAPSDSYGTCAQTVNYGILCTPRGPRHKWVMYVRCGTNALKRRPERCRSGFMRTDVGQLAVSLLPSDLRNTSRTSATWHAEALQDHLMERADASGTGRANTALRHRPHGPAHSRSRAIEPWAGSAVTRQSRA
jgi:hypothetical protein